MYLRAAPALAAHLLLLGVEPRVKWAVVSSRGPALADEPRRVRGRRLYAWCIT